MTLYIPAGKRKRKEREGGRRERRGGERKEGGEGEKRGSRIFNLNSDIILSSW